MNNRMAAKTRIIRRIDATVAPAWPHALGVRRSCHHNGEVFLMTSTTMIDAAADDFLGRTLLNDCQQDFPLCAMPFDRLPARAAASGQAILASID